MCECECIFSEMANFGMKFKSKCHGEGECVNERASMSNSKKREKKLLSENKTENSIIVLDFALFGILLAFPSISSLLYFFCDKAQGPHIHTSILNHHYTALKLAFHHSPHSRFSNACLVRGEDGGGGGSGGCAVLLAEFGIGSNN